MIFNIEEKKINYIVDNIELAYIDLDFTPDGLVVFEKVFVDPQLRGQGVAGQIMKFAADYFLEKKVTVVPLCSYANTWYLKNKDYLLGAKMPEDGPRCKL
ncbi:MAG: N-acetyltransferase [Spirochaetia bacterium]|nr:N-acetyltransferase [Spirochaetia bacterium]